MGVYSDEQWRWLHEQYVKGYPLEYLADFAESYWRTVQYHWERLGLYCRRDDLPALNRDEFNALGRKEHDG